MDLDEALPCIDFVIFFVGVSVDGRGNMWAPENVICLLKSEPVGPYV